jgi:hypothetical protein
MGLIGPIQAGRAISLYYFGPPSRVATHPRRWSPQDFESSLDAQESNVAQAFQRVWRRPFSQCKSHYRAMPLGEMIKEESKAASRLNGIFDFLSLNITEQSFH